MTISFRIATCAIFGLCVPLAIYASPLNLPEDVRYKCELASDFAPAAADDISSDQRVFLGAYGGQWEKVLDSYLIVESIDVSGTFNGFYYWGAYRGWNIEQSGCTPVTGTVRGNKLSFKTGTASVTYRHKGDYLNGTYTRGGNVTRGRFEFIE